MFCGRFGERDLNSGCLDSGLQYSVFGFDLGMDKFLFTVV